MDERGGSSAAAEMRAMAAQADAEAAEAEALATAARARARALELRRQAEIIEADEAHPAAPNGSAESPCNGAQPACEQRDIPTESEPNQQCANDSVAQGGADARPDDGSVGTGDQRAWYRRRPRLATLAATLAIIVTVISVGASAYVVVEHRNASQQRRRAVEFSAAARQGVVTLTSLDFNDAKAGVQRIIDNSTGSFRDDFAKMAADFTKVVEQSKVVEHGVVQAVAVDLDSMTNDSAVVLVASTSEVTNAAGAKQDPRNFKLIVTLTRDADQLKMSKVEFVS